jgi:serine/threonine-protein kinase
MSESEFGKYRLIAELGHGGMADVFLAVVRGPAGLGFSKLLVVKKLRPNLVEDPEFVAMLIDEARIAARLNHPNVVQTIEVGEVEGQYFIAMEFLEGQPLHRIMHRAERNKVQIPKLLHYRIVADVLAGLHHAHQLADYDGTSLEVVHRDVTPHNVFVTYEGQVKVVDFGVAKAIGRASETRTGVVKGKITYMAPEQAMAKPLDRRADLFSAGVLLWEGAAGIRMWKGMQDVEIMNRLLSGTIPASPKSVNPSAPDRIDAICRRALAIDPEQRYPTAEAFQNDIEAFLAEEGAGAMSVRGSVPRLHTNRDLGRLVSELFEDRRKQIRDVIERQLSVLKGESLRPPKPVAVDPSSNPTFSETLRSDGPVLPRPSSARARAEEAPSQDATAQTLVTSGDSISTGRRLGARVALGLAALLAIAGGLWARNLRSTTLPAGPPAAAPTEAAARTDGIPTSEPKPVESASLVLTLRANPPKTKFYLDDGPALDNPYIGTHPRDGMPHKLRIEAEGHVSKTRELVFDNDVVVDVALDKDKPRPPQRAAPPRPAPPAPPTKPPPKPARPLDTDNPFK